MNLSFEAAWVLIMAEVLAALIIMVTGYWVYLRYKKQQTINKIDRFIETFLDHGPLKTEPLGQLLSNSDIVDWETVEKTVQSVGAAERALFQQIIQFYLQQNPNLLKNIEKQIGNLSEPYFQLIKHLTKTAQSNHEATQNESILSEARSVVQVNQQLTHQLKHALQTIEEITNEYTRVFNGRQTALELENSSQKMIQLFREAEQQLKKINVPQAEDYSL